MTDLGYRTIPYQFLNRGILARYQYDRMPPGTYRNLRNLESRAENAISTRYGLAVLSTVTDRYGTRNSLLPAAAVSLGRMRGLYNPFNYAAGGGYLSRKLQDGNGPYSTISTGLSGSPVSMRPYRPANSSTPYMFFADKSVMLKDNGSGNAQKWGIAPPSTPALVEPTIAGLVEIDSFNTIGSYQHTNISPFTSTGRVQVQIQTAVGSFTPGKQVFHVNQINIAIGGVTRTSNVTQVVTIGPHGFVSGMRVAVVVTNSADNSFSVSSAIITVTSTTAFTYANPGTNQTSIGQITIDPSPSIQVGMLLSIVDSSPETVYVAEAIAPGANNAETVFVATFTYAHALNVTASANYAACTVAANTTGTVSKTVPLDLSFPSNYQVASDQNCIQIYLLASNPLALSQIVLQFDVGDGTFTQDYYSKSVEMSPAQPAASATRTASSVQTSAVFQRAAGAVNVSSLGGNNPSLLPTDYPILSQLQAANLNSGTNPWTIITVPLSEFVPNGAAGGPTNNWSNVVAWQVQIQTQPTMSVTVGLDDLVFIGGSDLNSNGGQAYDYRYTYLNINTGCESTPSVEMIGTNPGDYPTYLSGGAAPVPTSVQNQAIAVTMTPSTDSQVTHFNLYRRGGTLTQGWYFVAQVPKTQNVFTDTVADSTILVNNLLNVNADAPVTSLLPVPLNGTLTIPPGNSPGQITMTTNVTVYPGQLLTLGAGGQTEQAYVISVSGTSVTLYTQLFPSAGYLTSVPFTATTRPQVPMNLMTIAFDQAWLAGDPTNPHFLYYSVTYEPETFPVQNYLEIGTPDAPIMALIELNGLLFVFTTKRVYEVLGAGSGVPTVIPTGVKHGLSAQFGWCCSENVIYYISYDGIYAFSGGGSQYMSEPIEWIWNGKNLGPIPAMNPSQISNVFMTYADHEVYVAYTDDSGDTHRAIYHEVYRRWRNDDYYTGNITAQYFTEDVGILFVAKSDQLVYQDRVNDYDSGGYASGVQVEDVIPFSLQTAQFDHSEIEADYAKRTKVYNELTIDADVGTASVTVQLVFDSGNTAMTLGTIHGTGAGRQQYQFNINSGDGYRSLNVGLLLSGSTTTVIDFFEWQIRVVPEAEYRQSWDTYWLGEGVDEWHLVKQIFAEYAAPDPGGITVNAFIDGNMSVPAFTFTLPTTGTAPRMSKRVRFPATIYRLIRYIGTSSSPFNMYDDTQLEIKKLGAAKGYERAKISP